MVGPHRRVGDGVVCSLIGPFGFPTGRFSSMLAGHGFVSTRLQVCEKGECLLVADVAFGTRKGC